MPRERVVDWLRLKRGAMETGPCYRDKEESVNHENDPRSHPLLSWKDGLTLTVAAVIGISSIAVKARLPLTMGLHHFSRISDSRTLHR